MLILSMLLDFNSFNLLLSLQQLMSHIKSKKSSKIRSGNYKYRKYDYKKRQRLIEMVQKENKSLASAAKQLGIAQTTARLIMKTWFEQGRVFQKKLDKIKREKKEAVKQSQARRKEKQRLKKLSRMNPSQPERVQQPQNQMKGQQNLQPSLEEPRMAFLPPIPLDPSACFNPWAFQNPYCFVYPQPFYY